MSIAFVVPNLNNGAYLERALRSATSQTVPPDEVIVVDGGSRDASAEIARGFGVRWIEAPPRGMADARNVGICATRCEHVIPLDADDWVEPTFVEATLPLMAEGVGAVSTGLRWPDGRVQWPQPPYTAERFRTGNLLFCCSLLRRAAWESVGGYDVAKTYEDWLLWYELALGGWEIATAWEPLFHYCPHGEGSTARMPDGAHQRYVEYILRKHEETKCRG